MTRPTKSCRKCGATFTASPADTTVHCPDCRETARLYKPTATTQADVRIAQAKSRGYAARAAGDTEEYEKAIAELKYWQSRR